MACSKCGKACTCAVKRKRKPAVRRPPPARVLKGTTSTMVNTPGVDISSLVRIISDLNTKKPEQPIIPPAVTIGIPEAAKGIPRGVSVGTGTEKPVGISVGTDTMKRTTPYKSGFMSILPEVQKAAAIAERAVERARPAIIQEVSPAIAAEAAAKALETKTFTQTTGGGTRTFTIPELDVLFQGGQVIRPPGGRLPAGERQARELARAAQEAAGNVPPN